MGALLRRNRRRRRLEQEVPVIKEERVAEIPSPKPILKPKPDYSNLSYLELKEEARKSGIDLFKFKSKKDIIEQLSRR